MGSNVLDQQLGCLWQKDHLLSISLSGYINYLDKNNPSKPLRVIKVSLVLGMMWIGSKVLWSAVKGGNRDGWPREAEMPGFLGPVSFRRSQVDTFGHESPPRSTVSSAQLGSVLFSAAAAESHIS